MSNQRTPLHPWHVEHKARMVSFGGWEMPVQYAGIAAEHHIVRCDAGVFDISHMGRLSVSGPDALLLLERLFTNSVASMAVGQIRYGLFCQEDGGILDDVLVYRWADDYGVCVNASNREKIIRWIAVRKLSLDVSLRDHTFDTVMVAVQGPKALALCAGMFTDDPKRLKNYFGFHTSYRETPAIVSRTGYTGEDGLEIIVPNSHGLALWDDLIARSATPCGLGARDTLRLEAAMPLYGHELSEAIDPIHAGLGWAVKLDKGEFIGREALRTAVADREKPVRIGLEVDGKRAARETSTILNADGIAVGSVTSGSFCPWLDKSLAMGYVAPTSAGIGTKLLVDVRGSQLAAQVVPLPFYKRTTGSKS